MNIHLSYEKNIDADKLMNLYQNVGWSAYTEDLDLLKEAIQKSLDVVTAWEDGELVGLIRTIGDGLTILFIQDILIQKDYQNRGLGSRLLQEILEKYASVRQKVLLTEEA
ncbi:MAG: N-acetyltransferase, partial [Clostridia bacterium]|nr:N-acetyltransferase [Clostridia bacterium]